MKNPWTWSFGCEKEGERLENIGVWSLMGDIHSFLPVFIPHRQQAMGRWLQRIEWMMGSMKIMVSILPTFHSPYELLLHLRGQV